MAVSSSLRCYAIGEVPGAVPGGDEEEEEEGEYEAQ